jgi:hypothetical protein
MQNHPIPLLKTTVLDADAEGPVAHREIELQIEAGGIAIRPVGYGDKTSLDGQGSPVFVEFRNGIPVVVIWDDITEEEPSHVISLENATESNRREWSEPEPDCIVCDKMQYFG